MPSARLQRGYIPSPKLRPQTQGSARWFALSVGVLLTACSANKNYEERERYAEANDLLPEEGCIATCLETPAPTRVDCEAREEGYEFFPLIDVATTVTIYVYDDKTTGFGDDGVGYRPQAFEVPRCIDEDTASPNRVMGLRGGPFLSFGGGAGRSLSEITATPDLPISTEFGNWARDASGWEGISFWARRGIESQVGIRVAVGDKYVDDDLAYVDYYNRALDLPEDGDHPRAPRTYCRRARECDCQLGKPCSYFEGNSEANVEEGTYCWDPDIDLAPGTPKPSEDDIPPGTRFRRRSLLGPGGAEVFVADHDRCQQTACDRFYAAFDGKTTYPAPEDHCPLGSCLHEGERGGFDPEFNGRTCSTHTFSSGDSGDFCFNPGEDPPPPEGDEKCGDFWFAPVRLTTEWEFYTVPFNEMLQQGFAKESFLLDLENLSTIRFTWERGWAEYWIDNVNLYRRTPN